MMTLGLLTAILPFMSFKETVDYAAGTGLECLEVCCWPKGEPQRRYAGVTHIDLANSSDAGLLEYARYAGERGIKISSLCCYQNPLDGNIQAAEAAVRHIRRMILAAAKMNVGMITTFIGRDKTKNVDENLELFEQTWTPIVKLAEENKVKIAVENCAMLYTNDEWPGGNNLACAPYIWRKMFEIIKSDCFGLNYDPSHMALMQMDYIRPVYEFRDKIFHVHLKDILVRKDLLDEYGVFALPALWHIPKIPGLGELNFAKLISAFNDIRFQGCACIEVEDRAYEGDNADILRAVEQSYRYLRQYI